MKPQVAHLSVGNSWWIRAYDILSCKVTTYTIITRIVFFRFTSISSKLWFYATVGHCPENRGTLFLHKETLRSQILQIVSRRLN